MPPIKRKTAIRNLISKGFVVKDGKHKSLVLYHGGKREAAAITHVSHGAKSKELTNYHFQQMGRQLNLTAGQCKDLLFCPMEKEEFIRILIEKGLID